MTLTSGKIEKSYFSLFLALNATKTLALYVKETQGDKESWRKEGRAARDMRTQGMTQRIYLGFSCLLIYPRLEAEEAGVQQMPNVAGVEDVQQQMPHLPARRTRKDTAQQNRKLGS